MRKTISLWLILFVCTLMALSQERYDYSLRLEPVWSRVADALGEIGSVESAEFSSDGKYIVSGSKYDNSVVMWRTSDGAELWRNYAAEEVERVGWSSDGAWVAAASEDYLVTVYDATNGEVHKELQHSRGIDGLTWSHNGLLLATGEEKSEMEDGSLQGFIRIFRMPEAKEIQTLDFGNTVNELFFSSDDQYLLAIGHGDVKVYRTGDWSLVQTLSPGYYVTFTTGSFSPDRSYVIAAGQGQGSRGTVFLWEWESGKLVKQFNHTGKKIESITFHPSGQYVVHAGHTPYIHVYRLEDILQFGHDQIREAHRVWASDHAEYIDFNSDGSFLVSAHQNGLINLWVWMGEDPELNSKRHDWVKTRQTDAKKK